MADSLQRLGLNQLNHKLKIRRGGIEVTSGNISGSSTSTGSFGKLEVAGNSTLTGDLTLGGNIQIGDADTDSITITADLSSSIIPDADNTYDIGSSAKQWKDIYVNGIGYIDQLGTDGDPVAIYVNSGELDGVTIGGESAAAGTFTFVTATGTISGSAVYGTTIGQNRTDGVKTITIEANSTINQDVTTDANPTFAGVTADNVQVGVTAAGEIDTSGGNLTIDSAGGTTTIDDILSVAGAATFDSTITSTGNLSTAGVLSGSSDIIVGNIGGSHISGSTGNLKVTDSLLATKVSGSEFTGSSANFDAATITTATIAGGTVTGITDLAVADGGTGAGTFTDGGVLLGSGTDAITAMAALGDGEMIVGDGSGDPVAESGATLRTSIGVGTGDSPQFTGVTATGTITGSAVYGTTIGQNRTNGVKTITIEANSVVNQDLTTDASPTFAGITSSGDIVAEGDVIAQNYIVSSSVTYLTQSFASGSNIFGDSMDDTHVFSGSLDITGSNYISGTLNVQAEGVYSSSTAIYTNNITNGYPTSNPWGTSLGGSYFNNFDNTTHVSEILRFMSGVLSHSLDVADASPNTKTLSAITTTETNLGSTDWVDGYLPQSYDSSNATMKYLVTKNWVSDGSTVFSGISVYHDNGPTYKIDFTSVTGSTTTISSSADAQLFGLGGLSTGAATRLDVRVMATQSFSDTGSIANPSSSYKYTSQSFFDVALTDFGTSNGVTLAKINTTQPAVIPAGYQDGKFANVGGTDMTGSLTRKYHASKTDFTSVSSSGYYNFHDLKVGLATGSGNFAFHTGSSQNRFWAPIDQIETDIGTNTLGITSVTQSYVSATSRSLSGAPYLIGATYHLSASVHGLFDPMYKDSSTIADDTISSVGVGSVAATSGVDGLSTSGGTIQTANAVLSTSGSGGTLRSTSTVPTRTDVYRHNAIYTLSGTTGENVSQTGVSDSTFTIGVRGRNRANSRSTLATYTFFYHSGSTFGQPASSGSMAVYQRSQGYDGGALAGTTELFTGEDFRIRNTNDVTGFNGLSWFTNFTSSQDHLGTYDLQVKPGYLVDPGGTYRYWYPENYHSSATYKYYIRRFQISGTKSSMTVNLNNNTLVNWKAATNDKVACAILFKSSASGSGTNNELSRARIYDPSETTANAISSSIANDNFLNPFSSAIDLYGNTGGSIASNTYTVPMRNSDGMYLDNDDNELYVIVRYTGDPTPIDDITLTFS